MEEKFLKLLLASDLSEKEKLELVFNKHIDMDSGIIHMDVAQFDNLLADIMQFYHK